MRRKWTIRDPRFQADRICPQMPVWPWAGHRNFAYDLVRWIRPRRIAELGVHWGTSFFAFAQAVKDGRMDCELIGVDTFQGDPHAGEYGEEVLQTVRRIIDRYFSRHNIVLHRSLFRDTAPDTGYGSADFWKEVSQRYPSFAFTHSWGLGVLFPKGDRRLAQLRAMGLDDKILLYQHRAEARLTSLRLEDASRLARQRMDVIRRQSERIAQAGRTVQDLRGQVDRLRAESQRRLAHIERLTDQRDAARALARERLDTINDQSRLADSLRAALQQRTRERDAARALARERLDTINKQARLADSLRAALRQRTRERDAARDLARQRMDTINEQSARIERLRQTVGTLREDLARARDLSLQRLEALRAQAQRHADASRAAAQRIAALTDSLKARGAELRTARDLARSRMDAIRSQGARIESQRRRIESLAQHLERARRAVALRDERIASLLDRCSTLRQRADRLALRLEDSDAALARSRAVIGALNRYIEVRNAMIDQLRKHLDSLRLDVELLAVRTEHAETVLASHREQIAALLQTRPGRAAAKRLSAQRPEVVVIDPDAQPADAQ